MCSNIWLKCAQTGNLSKIKQMKENLSFLDINCVTALNQSALMLAIANNHKELVDYLITLDSDLNIEDKLGENALSHAIRQKNTFLVQRLYKKGCKISKSLNKATRDPMKLELKSLKDWSRKKPFILAHLRFKNMLI
jgi:ankyrin repeat protein